MTKVNTMKKIALLLSVLFAFACAELPSPKTAEDVLKKATVVCASQSVLPGDVADKVGPACKALKDGAKAAAEAAGEVLKLVDAVE